MKPPPFLSLGLIGWPLTYSLSQQIHQYWLKKFNLPGRYEIVPLSPEKLQNFVQNFRAGGWQGANVTAPYKEAILSSCDHLTERAQLVGAVNTLWLENNHLWGDNTDVEGFRIQLERTTPFWRHRTRNVLILGAGGAARAVVYALIEPSSPSLLSASELEKIYLVNRTPNRAQECVHHFRSLLPASQICTLSESNMSDILPHIDLLIQTRSLDAPLFLPSHPKDRDKALTYLPSHAIVYDLLYTVGTSKILKQAQESHLSCVEGRGMLLHQAAGAFQRWTGIYPEITEELKEKISPK